MKIIVCGPPHSGKSVFIANLERYLPSDSYITVRVHKDGEGSWSNNLDQLIIQAVRNKEKYDESFIEAKCDDIKNIRQDIILIDIGGKLKEDKKPVFKAADAFIVLSNSPEYLQKWYHFGKDEKKECIALLDSCQNDSDELYKNNDTYIRGKISNLERGTFKENDNIILKTVAEVLIKKSGYIHKIVTDPDILDLNLVANNLKFTNEYGNSFFPPEKSLLLKNYIEDNYTKNIPYKINGARANWVASLVTITLKKNGQPLPFIFNVTTSSYFPISKIRVSNDFANPKINIYKEESDESVFIDFKPNGDIALNDLNDFVLPEISHSKILYISGRIPNWLLCSIIVSYQNPEKYVFQPGNNFVCIESDIPNKIGTSSESPDRINYLDIIRRNQLSKS